MTHEKYRIVTAWAETASGPGWSNRLVYYIWQGEDNALHMECLQPGEQSRDMNTLRGVSQAAHNGMTLAVERWLQLRETT